MPVNWRPVGPEPASTYWTRRAVLALVAVVVLYGVAVLLTGGADDDTLDSAGAPGSVEPSASSEAIDPPTPTGEPTADPSAEPSAEASSSPGPDAEPPPCADSDLEVTAEADQEVYAPGATPTLLLTVRNTSDRPCRRDLGQGAAELVVTSGPDRIWSSDDCAPGGPPGPRVLAPDEADVDRVVWSATRSQPGCQGDKAPVQPGTYVVSGRISDLRVEGASFRFEG